MKISYAQTTIAVAVSLLIAYGLYSFHDSENRIVLSIGSFVSLATALVLTIAAGFELPRTTANIRVVSGSFFAIALVSNLIFTFVDYSVPSYVVVNGLLLLVFISIVYSMYKAKR